MDLPVLHRVWLFPDSTLSDVRNALLSPTARLLARLLLQSIRLRSPCKQKFWDQQTIRWRQYQGTQHFLRQRWGGPLAMGRDAWAAHQGAKKVNDCRYDQLHWLWSLYWLPYADWNPATWAYRCLDPNRRHNCCVARECQASQDPETVPSMMSARDH